MSGNASERGLVAHPAFKMFVGAFAAVLVIVPLSRWLVTQATFEPADVGAMVVAALLMIGGAMTFLPTLDRRTLSRALEPEAGERASLPDSEIAYLRLQGLLMVLAGGLLAAPPMLSDRPEWLGVGYLGLVAAFALQCALNIAAWRGGDAFHRRLFAETAALCFWTLQGALFLWAAAERMGLAPPISAWGALVIVMAVYLLSGAVTAVRRTSA